MTDSGVHLGDLPHVGVIAAVRMRMALPPYEVRWPDDGRYAPGFPGPEARVEPVFL
ncbi:DUF1918 domain-containing protein [Krasilnikovia sp. MM14-A1004]|uniref:DUF1918 domain-containing protein n=1 Tax=Krasilnikovia sp. MM14-A1004 TaxID=3373541 RepID=UPI00399C8CEE